MKIAYIVNARIPTEKAHGYQIMKVCEEFSRQGDVVQLVIPSRKNTIQKDAFTYYDIEPLFSIKKIPIIDFVGIRILKRFAFFCRSIYFLCMLVFYRPTRDTVIFSRNPEIIWLFSARGYRTLYNAHNWPLRKNRLLTIMISGCGGIVANSEGTAMEFKKRGFKKVLAIPNGVDLHLFENSKESKKDLRAELCLSKDTKIIMYVGHLYHWKGIDTVIDTAILMQKENVAFIVIGGTFEDQKKYEKICREKNLQQVYILGHKEKKEIPQYLMSADILLLPNIPSTPESKLYTSPIKMFEYMASEVPIIASDLPSIREVLNPYNSILVRAGDAVALTAAIRNSTPEISHVISQQAKKDAYEFTWEKHVRKIREFIK